MRTSLKKSNVIPMDLGRDRYEAFKLCIGPNLSVTEALIEHMESVIRRETLKQKKVEGQPNPLSLPVVEYQTTLEEYLINPFRTEEKKLETLRKYLLFDASREQITQTIIVGNRLRNYGNFARSNYDRRIAGIIKR
jgi:hypothetical protein